MTERAALFVTCLADTLFPEVGRATVTVLERLGMRREAHLVENEYFKGELTSEFDYAILEREWAARRATA